MLKRNYGIKLPVREAAEKITLFQIIILLLSTLVLASLLTDTVVVLPREASRLLQFLDNVVCVLFVIDFVARYRRASDKLQFLKWGWIDLVASIPNIDILRWGRIVRILRIIRILRGIRSFQKVFALLFQHRVRNGLASVLTTSFLLVIFSSVAILLCEKTAQSNIQTVEDAVWWSVTTITTVGYGDKYPITLEGRIIAMILMVAGVGLFGTLSGLVALYFLGPKGEARSEHEQLIQEIRTLQNKVDELSKRETPKQ